MYVKMYFNVFSKCSILMKFYTHSILAKIDSRII